MADVKISELTYQSILDGTEEFPMVQGSTTKRTKLQNMRGYTDYTKTLTAGQTSVEIRQFDLDTKTIDIYTSVFGVNPTAVVVTNSYLRLTFEAQQIDVDVKVRVS